MQKGNLIMKDYNKLSFEEQVNIAVNELSDVNSHGTERPWKDKKLRSNKLGDAYLRLGDTSRAIKVYNCANYLEFQECENHHRRLKSMHTCQNRLCPICNWRRSLRLSQDVIKILHTSYEKKPMEYIFVTLTVKNCKADELSGAIDKLMKAYKKLFLYADVDKIALGWQRCLEVTYNSDIHSKDYNTYHPHFHVIVGVNKSYFKAKGYINQAKWIELWQKALGVDYAPWVHVQKVKPRKEGQDVQAAALESTKYAVKDSDYLIFKEDGTIDYSKTDRVVKTLTEALRYRRLIAYGKLFKEVKKELKIADIEDADLIHIDEDGEVVQGCTCPICQSQNLRDVIYKWHSGYGKYLKLDYFREEGF
jgi:plasmid rolling circle replication initiator protein Rep